MSNLVKSRNIICDSNDKKIIDYNELISTKLSMIKDSIKYQPEPLEIVDGVNADSVQELLEDNTSDTVIENANTQAKKIIARANEDAKAIIERAKEESDIIRADSANIGRNEGYEEGHKKAEIELAALKKSVEDEKVQMEIEYNQRLNEMEPMLVETFEKYSIFELQSDGENTQSDLQSYKPTYLPDGAELKNTVEQPEMLAYEYAINESSYFNILLSKSDTRIYADAENTEIESFDKDGVIGYYFKKDDLNYICYERDGDFFSIYGSIDMDELIKIAAGITTE